MQSFLILVDTLLAIYMWMLIIAVIMSWLTAFNVINTHNRFVYLVYDFLYRATEPPMRYLRRWIPDLGGIDLTPLLLIILIVFLRNLLREYGSPF
jgi:YggT family protein